MNSSDPVNPGRMFLAMAPAGRRERHVALVIAAASVLLFIAIVPFARVPLAKMPAFIPSYEAALFFIDLITAALLFDQSIRLRSIAILMLACGYLFDALIIVPHALSFPGALAPTGLLGAKEQTTAWLYVFWHGCFPLFVIAYALLRRREATALPSAQMRVAVVASVTTVALLAVALTLLATWGHDRLPVVMRGSDYSLLVGKGVSPAVWGLTLVAMAALWQRKQRVMDLWLMLVMWVWLFDIALSAVIGSSRFDLGFYAGRLFGLIAASFLLITLLVELARLHAGALEAAAMAERKFAELAHGRGRHEPAPPTRGEPTEGFVHRHNIARYRTLLEAGTLDEKERNSIERLLTEEIAKGSKPDISSG